MTQKSSKSFVILIVDDNLQNLQVLGGILREQNYSVLAVQNGASAIKMMERIHPHLILLDIMMPDIDGIQVCARLKQDSNTADIPIIFISAKNDEATIVKGFNAGGADYITKPFIASELLARVKHQLKISQNERSLLEIIEMKNKFFSVVTHNLKDPISKMIGLAAQLPQKIEKEDYTRAMLYAQEIHQSAVSQFKMLENLLEWARIQLDTITPISELVFPNDASNEALNIYQISILQKNISIKTNIAIDSIRTDPRLLQTILRNIISNAIKFTPQDGTIFIDAFLRDQSIVISIKNTGPGLNPSELEYLRSQDTNIENMQHINPNIGAGLGLKICKELLSILNGALEIDSHLGYWTKFMIILPKQ